MRRLLLLAALAAASVAPAQAPLGYYRYPALHGDTLVFTAEGDLWIVSAAGGTARRLTTHPGEESRAAISPDGRTVAFTATYEGPAEVYTMALAGGLPARRTYEGGGATVTGWTPDGKVLYATRRYATLPATQLAAIDLATNRATLLPLAEASEGTYDAGGTLYFTRLAFQGSWTRRYQGGTAQNIWRFAPSGGEAAPMTADFAGTSKAPMWWNGRIWFASDRDGTMNLWSMDAKGGDLKQHTRHVGFDVIAPSMSDGRIAYQLGADLRLFDARAGTDAPIPIRLASDFDQMREKWVKSPVDWVAAAHVSPNGDRVALTARGEVFVAPLKRGRLVEVTRTHGVRYRDAQFLPDGKSLVVMSDESGEVEFWRASANGVGNGERLTTDGHVLRWGGVPSPDGKWLAHADKDQVLWLLNLETKQNRKLATSARGDFGDLGWSPDSRWLAYTRPAPNDFSQLLVCDVASGVSTPVTTDRYDSYSPAWSPDGKWLYFLSDREFRSLVGAPWGSRQPEPFFDRQTRLFALALVKDAHSPFRAPDELAEAKPDASAAPAAGAKRGAATPAAGAKGAADSTKAPVTVTIDLDGIAGRLTQVPVPAGNYGNLTTNGKRLFWMSAETSAEQTQSLMSAGIDNERTPPETVIGDIRGYELSADGTKLMVRKGQAIYVFDAAAKAPSELAKSQVDLHDWTFSLDPREEWRQMFVEAWRLERDYFYDRGMHGVDWPKMRDKYLPLAQRVTDRAELSDVLAQMVGELSALHIFVRGGDLRRGDDQVQPATLGARLERDEGGGGYRVAHIYRSDPDRPDRLAPLARPETNVAEGEVIEAVNGAPALSVPDISMLLRNQADKQVLLKVRAAGGASRDAIVVPISGGRDADLRYDEWEYTRRLAVDKAGGGAIGYLHLRAMGGGDIADFEREFYPSINRQGLVIDARTNRGGNIDSWVLEKLMRKAWAFWQPRVGEPYWNMQNAFRGHLVVLVNQQTASDGELFAEGFRRLGLGKVIGTRTWGGEIWLSASNFLVDRGIATAAENGVYGPEGAWLIEGHGVDPDTVVDNLPAATFRGEDAQLDAAIKYLQEQIRLHPVPVPAPPKYPVKAGP